MDIITQIILIGLVSVFLCLCLSLFLFFRGQKYRFQLQANHNYITKLEQELIEAKQLCENLRTEKFDSEKQSEIYKERLHALQKSLEDWDKAKEESIKHAKAAIFEVGNQLSSKLMDDYKRESEDSRKSSQEANQKIQEQFQSIINSVISLETKVKESSDSVDIVRRSLLSPGGAGCLAEITLENILKSSGLISGTDFMMQYEIKSDSQERLRPDAVVFLPAGNVIIIDSKTSKFFLEIEEAKNTEESTAMIERLRITLRNHIKELTSRDYKNAILAHLKKMNRQVSHVSTIMFLPSEAALEKLQLADKEFLLKAWEANIFPSGPVGLVNILSHAKFQITEQRQLHNHQLILDEVQKLLTSVSNLYDHAKKLGSAIHSVANNYDRMAASFNSNLLSKIRNLKNLGLELPNQKSLATSLDRYQLVQQNNLIELEIRQELEEITEE